VPDVLGFESEGDRADHYYQHVTLAGEFDFDDDLEYEAAAIAFMNKAVDGVIIEEDVRVRDGTTIRFDRNTNEICFVQDNGFIGTYFKVRRKNPYAYFEKVSGR
jgi:hypothetical protein